MNTRYLGTSGVDDQLLQITIRIEGNIAANSSCDIPPPFPSLLSLSNHNPRIETMLAWPFFDSEDLVGSNRAGLIRSLSCLSTKRYAKRSRKKSIKSSSDISSRTSVAIGESFREKIDP